MPGLPGNQTVAIHDESQTKEYLRLGLTQEYCVILVKHLWQDTPLLSAADSTHSLAMSSDTDVYSITAKNNITWPEMTFSVNWPDPLMSGVKFPSLAKAHTSQIPLWWPAQDVQVMEFY